MIDFEKLNPMQQKAVLQKEGPVLILAGAGSGKTGALTVRIAELLKDGIRPWNLLAITFTNKAAKEMKERVTAVSYTHLGRKCPLKSWKLKRRKRKA